MRGHGTSGPLQVTLLGGLQVRRASGATVPVPGRKVQALLGYLALRPGQAHAREKLAALLWGDVPHERARHSLRQALAVLRQALAGGDLLEDSDPVALNAAGIETDVERFEGLVADGRPAALEEATSLYRGDLLEGLAPQAGPFEEWLLPERERLRELALEAMARLLVHRTKTGPVDLAIGTAVRLLGLDPLQESVHRALMRLYARAGRWGAALRQYQTCVAALEHDLSVAPEAETRRLYREILQSRSRLEESGAPPAAPAPTSPETVVIGRTQELAWLEQQRDAAWEGQGRVAMIHGEAGIGKTRVAEEIIAGSAARGGRVLLGRAHATQQPLPFGPWVEAVRSAGALMDLAADLAQPWKHELARLFPELGGATAPARPAADDSIRLFEGFAQLLAAVGKTPLVVVLEDLHWADEMSLRLLAFIGRRLGTSKTLVVVTVRDEELMDAPVLRRVVEELEREDFLASMPLAGLSRSDTLALATALGSAGVEASRLARLGDQLWTATGGNPFVVVETVRALRELGVPPPEVGLPIPRRVRDLIADRLGRLSEPGRRLAAAAAVIGREFDFALAQHASGLTPADAAEAVEELARRRLLHIVGEHLDFTHDRIREVAYGQLLPPRRQVLHAAIAEALEALHAGKLEEVYDRIAFHYAQTDRDDMAVRYLTLFAERAVLSYAFAEAGNALHGVVHRLERRPGEPDGRRIVEAVSGHAYCLRCLGRFSESADVLRSQERRVEQLGDAALAGPLFYQLSLNYGRLGHHELSITFADRARVEAIRGQDRLTEGLAHYGLSFTAYYAGRPREGIEHARRAMAALECLPGLDFSGGAPAGTGLNRSPFTASSSEQTERASMPPARTHKPLRGASGLYTFGIAHLVLGLNQSLLGDLGAALEAMARFDAIGETLGDSRLRSVAAGAAALIEITRGEWHVGLEACRRSLELSTDPVVSTNGSGILGWACLEGGDPAGALAPLEHAVEQSARFQYRYFHGLFSTILGAAHLELGHIEQARARTLEGLRLGTEFALPYVLGWARRGLGCIAQAGGALAEANGHLREAIATFDAIPAPIEVARARLDLSTVAAARHQQDIAARLLEEARASFTSLRVPRWVERAEALAAHGWP